MTRNTLAPWAEPVSAEEHQGLVRMTANELLALGDAGQGYELVEGVLVKMSSTGGGHGDLAQDLGWALRGWVKPRGLGRVVAAETGFVISQPGQPDTVLAPDTAFVRAERLPSRDTPEWDGFWRLAPDLVAEVASPSQTSHEIAAKARVWLTAGARLVWVIWPARRQVDVWQPGSDQPVATLNISDALDGIDVLPGFTYALVELFS